MEIRKSAFVVTIVLSVAAGSGITASLTQMRQTNSSHAPSGTNVTLQGADPAEVKKLQDVYSTLKKDYVTSVDDAKLIDGAIHGMMSALDDPFSSYMDAATSKQFHDTINPSFGGIGAEIQQEKGRIVVKSAVKGSPAEKAGIRAGDAIRKVDGKSIDNLTADQAVLLIRGKIGTTVQLDISRGGSEDLIHLSIVRDTIAEETVFGRMLPNTNGIGDIQITQFSEQTAQQFNTALSDLEKQGLKGLIIDLRDNPGGFLTAVNNIADDLIPNQKIIVQVEDREGHKDIYRSKLTTPKPYPIVAVINGGSASAAEILAAAIKEAAGGKLVGEKSFGKGTVQETQDFPDGSNIKFTIAKWLTPNGNWIHKKGIEPDFAVALPDYFSATAFPQHVLLKPDENDTQVKNLQLILSGVGYDPGRRDGYYDVKTEEAVKQFQHAKNLTASGTVDDATASALMNALHDKAQNNDTQLDKAISVIKDELK